MTLHVTGLKGYILLFNNAYKSPRTKFCWASGSRLSLVDAKWCASRCQSLTTVSWENNLLLLHHRCTCWPNPIFISRHTINSLLIAIHVSWATLMERQIYIKKSRLYLNRIWDTHFSLSAELAKGLTWLLFNSFKWHNLMWAF